MPCSIASTSNKKGARSSSVQQHRRPCPGSWALARARIAFLWAWIAKLGEKERAARRLRVSIQMGVGGGGKRSKPALQGGGRVGRGVALASVSSPRGTGFVSFPSLHCHQAWEGWPFPKQAIGSNRLHRSLASTGSSV